MKPYSQNTVVIEVKSGVAEVAWKPTGINLIIVDGDCGEQDLFSALDEVGTAHTQTGGRG